MRPGSTWSSTVPSRRSSKRRCGRRSTASCAASVSAAADVDRFACHPGGAKVIAALEAALELKQGTLDHEREVLSGYGNMSAPTVMFVMERLLKAGLPQADGDDGDGAGLFLCVPLPGDMISPALILAFVTLQRLGELVLARRNTARLLARGAREAGAGHYPLIVLLHAAWLAGLWALALDHPPNLFWLGGLRRSAAPAGLGDLEPGRALDDAHHRTARGASGDGGPVPLRVASQLLRRGGGDPGAAAGLRAGLVRASCFRS